MSRSYSKGAVYMPKSMLRRSGSETSRKSRWLQSQTLLSLKAINCENLIVLTKEFELSNSLFWQPKFRLTLVIQVDKRHDELFYTFEISKLFVDQGFLRIWRERFHIRRVIHSLNVWGWGWSSCWRCCQHGGWLFWNDVKISNRLSLGNMLY